MEKAETNATGTVSRLYDCSSFPPRVLARFYETYGDHPPSSCVLPP